MSETASPPPPGRRSGCAILSGVMLIGLGTFLLSFNLYGLSFLRRAAVGFEWLSIYWPAGLVIWGIVKVWKRSRAPEGARVSGLEVLGLGLFVFVGVTLSASRHGFERLARDGDWNRVVEALGPELLGPRHEFVRAESFPLESGQALVIDNGRGAVRVTGWDENRIEAELVTRLHDLSEADARKIADAVSLELDTEGERRRLRVSGTERHSVETELRLRLPRDTALEVHTRRGEIELEDVSAGARLRTSRASIEARRVTGDLWAQTDRGALRLSDLAGNVEASTRRGAVFVRRIGGNLDARTTNAALVIEDVSGSATLSNRHGSVRSRRVSGAVAVDAYDSDISVEAAESTVRIETSRASVFVRDVASNLSIRAPRSSVQVASIGGDLVVEGEEESITVTDVHGTLSVIARRSDVQATRLRGPATIEGQPQDVDVSDFSSSLAVRSRHGDISVETADLGGTVDLQTSYGNVGLTLPRTVSAQLEARTLDGELHAEVSQMDLETRPEEPGRRWSATFGGGTHSVTIVSEHGDVRLRMREP